MNILVAGAGGFIGGHLVRHLLDELHTYYGPLTYSSRPPAVTAVDIKPVHTWEQIHMDAINIGGVDGDLRQKENCYRVTQGMDWVYNLAADMGGIGFIENHKVDCMLSVLINTHLLMAATANGVKRYFYSSSACVYPDYKQNAPGGVVEPLAEGHAYPAMPEDGYGWEKLFSERMCRHFAEDFGLDTRVARFHNVYGPYGTWQGGREKAPAAICRKVAQAVIKGRNKIEVWGDGTQQRSFMWIEDCIVGIQKFMLRSKENWPGTPINLGSSELVSVNDLITLVEEIAREHCSKHKIEEPPPLGRYYALDAPKGVPGRNSDNTLIKELFRWEPDTPLRDGMTKTYEWIYDQVEKSPLGDIF